MDEDVLEEIRYYEKEKNIAINRRDELERQMQDLNKKYQKNQELTKQYIDMVKKIGLTEDEIFESEKHKKEALNNLKKNFQGVSATKILKTYIKSYAGISTVKQNLATCITEANTKLKKLSSEKIELEKQIANKKIEKKKNNNYIDYCNRKLESLY